MAIDYNSFIRDIPDYPKPGITFKDITPLLQDANALRQSILDLAAIAQQYDVTHIAGIESRGFIFGTALAVELSLGFLPIRKPGKLPWKTFAESYDLEYGSDKLEIHIDASAAGERVLLIDDLLATGGTAEAAVKLIRHTGAEVVACCVVLELEFLSGRDKMHGVPMHSLIKIS
ncbi:MAG: adenine phosphoribosyltransferase [Planctomycetes bacterium]|nr:adenine phosphoribosyltransferase [Planctomycetota bacterium]